MVQTGVAAADMKEAVEAAAAAGGLSAVPAAGTAAAGGDGPEEEEAGDKDGDEEEDNSPLRKFGFLSFCGDHLHKGTIFPTSVEDDFPSFHTFSFFGRPHFISFFFLPFFFFWRSIYFACFLSFCFYPVCSVRRSLQISVQFLEAPHAVRG